MHGGKRIGSGRPPGALNARTRAILEEATSGGETPFAYVLRVMRDEKAREIRRDEMAKVAVVYLSKLSKHVDLNADEEMTAEAVASSAAPNGETELATATTPLAEMVE